MAADLLAGLGAGLVASSRCGWGLLLEGRPLSGAARGVGGLDVDAGALGATRLSGRLMRAC